MQTRDTQDVEILRLGSKRLPSAARTLSLSFTNDPLITWLYRSEPDPGQPWGELDPLHVQWQQRRVQWCATTDLVAAASMRASNDATYCPGMMILKPPSSWSWSLWRRPVRWLDVCKLYVLDLLQKPEEQACDKLRAKRMYEAHDRMMETLTKRDECWYLEAIAVDPQAQGHGVGGRLMRWLLATIGDEADCILECTDEANVPFYEKYGFRQVEVIELQDEHKAEHSVKEYIMMRAGLKRARD